MLCGAESLMRSVWFAQSTVINGVRQYGVPVEYRLNYRDLDTSAEIMAFGPEYVNYKKIVAPNRLFTLISEFDRAWIDRTPATPSDALAKDATHQVVGVTRGAGGIGTILLRKVSRD